MRELLTDYNVLCTRTGQTVQKEYNELLACLNDLYEQYNICEHDYEWYPYYINGIFYPVDKVINERRKVYGMTVEELAGTELDVGTVSRIINGKNMPRRNTIDILLKNLAWKVFSIVIKWYQKMCMPMNYGMYLLMLLRAEISICVRRYIASGQICWIWVYM